MFARLPTATYVATQRNFVSVAYWTLFPKWQAWFCLSITNPDRTKTNRTDSVSVCLVSNISNGPRSAGSYLSVQSPSLCPRTMDQIRITKLKPESPECRLTMSARVERGVKLQNWCSHWNSQIHILEPVLKVQFVATPRRVDWYIRNKVLEYPHVEFTFYFRFSSVVGEMYTYLESAKNRFTRSFL